MLHYGGQRRQPHSTANHYQECQSAHQSCSLKPYYNVLLTAGCIQSLAEKLKVAKKVGTQYFNTSDDRQPGLYLAKCIKKLSEREMQKANLVACTMIHVAIEGKITVPTLL